MRHGLCFHRDYNLLDWGCSKWNPKHSTGYTAAIIIYSQNLKIWMLLCCKKNLPSSHATGCKSSVFYKTIEQVRFTHRTWWLLKWRKEFQIHYLHWELQCSRAQALYLSLFYPTTSNPWLNKHTCCPSKWKQMCYSVSSSLQRNSWCSWTGMPISRKWILIGFKPILPYICDPMSMNTLSMEPWPSSAQENMKGTPLWSFWELFHTSSHHLQRCCIRTNVWCCNNHFSTMTWQVLSGKGNALRRAEQKNRTSLGLSWSHQATAVPGTTHPRTSLTGR